MKICEELDYLTTKILDEHKKVFANWSMKEFEKLLELLSDAVKIFVAGAGREGIAARGFAMRLMHLGKEVHWVWDDTTPGIKEDDIFLVVNGSGNIGHIDYLIGRARAVGAKVVVITGAPKNFTINDIEHCVFIPACVYKGDDPRAVDSIQPMGSLFEQHLFLFFDIVIMLLQKKMGRTNEELEVRHRNIE